MSFAGTSAVLAKTQHIWRIHKPPLARGRQGKLDPTRRLKAKAVREMRACLRCSALRIPCSQDDICIPCRKLVEIARHPYEKRTLSWCGCIRTRLLEANPFEAAIPPPHMLYSVLESTDSLGLRSIKLSFESQVTWELPTIILELVEWLDNPACFTTSKVGLLSSPHFINLMEPYIGAEIGADFQRMLYIESLVYTQATSYKKHNLGVKELQQIGAVGGHAILSFLDKNLKAEALRACSKAKERLEALFLLVIGTILAVGYASPYIDCDGAMGAGSSTGIVTHAQFTAMQDHLCQILAHYVLLLASRLNLPIPSTTESFILKAASKRWHKHGMFLWVTCFAGGSTFCWDTPSPDLFTFAEPQDSQPLHCALTEALNSRGLDSSGGLFCDENLCILPPSDPGLAAAVGDDPLLQDRCVFPYCGYRSMGKGGRQDLLRHYKRTHRKDIAIKSHVHTKNDFLPTSPSDIGSFQTFSKTSSNAEEQDILLVQKRKSTAFQLLNGCRSAELTSHISDGDVQTNSSKKGACAAFDSGDPEKRRLVPHCYRSMLSKTGILNSDSYIHKGHYGGLPMKEHANATGSKEISQPPLPRLPDVIQNPEIWGSCLRKSMEGYRNSSYKEGVLEQIKAEQNLLV